MLANTHISAQSAAVIWIMVLDLFSRLFTPLACSHISRRLAAVSATHHSHSQTSRPASQFKHCDGAARYVIGPVSTSTGSTACRTLFLIDCRTKKQQKLRCAVGLSVQRPCSLMVATIRSWNPVDWNHVSSEQKIF